MRRPGVNWEGWPWATGPPAPALWVLDAPGSNEWQACWMPPLPSAGLPGMCGGLDPNLHSGDLIVGNSCLHGADPPVSGAAYTTRAGMWPRKSGLSVQEGPVLKVGEPLLSPQAKRRASGCPTRRFWLRPGWAKSAPGRWEGRRLYRSKRRRWPKPGCGSTRRGTCAS